VIGGNKGYQYNDPSASSDGVKKVALKANAVNKTRVFLKGKGAGLPDMTVPLPLPITAQLINDENSTCFTASFSSASRNSNGLFKAKNP